MIRILIPIHTVPDVTSVTTILFENILPVLRTKTKVHVLWFVYTPDKLSLLSGNNHPDFTILDIHNYKNAMDVLQKEKPDLIYSSPTWDLMDFAFSSAGKSLHIPTFSVFFSTINPERPKIKIIKSLISRFLENSIPTDTDKNKKQFMRRGRFFIYKYFFLIHTQRSIKLNWFQIIKLFFLQLSLNLSNKLDPRFENDIHFLDSERVYRTFLNSGFKKSSLVITGNPIYDVAYRKLNDKKLPIKTDSKIKLLLIPAPLYEHGFWTREQRDFLLKEIVTKIAENKTEMSLTVKIHPASSILSEYKSLIHSIDSSIPVYQSGDILEFLENADVAISFKSGTPEVYALLAKKPIVICNFFNISNDQFLENTLAYECKDKSSLIDVIRESLSSNDKNEQKRENFIKEFMYKWDGLAAERISNEIINLLQNNRK